MLKGDIVVIEVRGGRVVNAARNVQGLSVVVINHDTPEDKVAYPPNMFYSSQQLNALLDVAEQATTK